MSVVNLVTLSSPSAYTECYTAEQFIAYAARVSNPANQNNTQTAKHLIKYLIREHHWSPFEMVSVTMEIVTTRDISRQILRHRSFSFQEFSQRYAVSENFVSREARLQDLKNRQNSVSIDKHDDRREMWNMKQHEVIRKSQEVYQWALDNNIAKEQARAVLPEGNTETTLYMSGTLRSWIHYCDLRMSNGTQKEHMVVAQQCWNVLEYHFPNVCNAVTEIKGATNE